MQGDGRAKRKNLGHSTILKGGVDNHYSRLCREVVIDHVVEREGERGEHRHNNRRV